MAKWYGQTKNKEDVNTMANLSMVDFTDKEF
jgi:hypothetical protein